MTSNEVIFGKVSEEGKLMIEVERKFRIDSNKKASLIRKLTKFSEKIATVHQVDTVFLRNSESFEGFKRGDPVVRVRIENNKATLTYKRALNDQGDAVEHEMLIDPPGAGEEILKEVGFKLVTKISKERTNYKSGDISIAVDKVQSLGVFLEIETLCASEQELPSAQVKIMNKAKELGLNESDIEPKKYDQLMSKLR